MRLDTRSGWLLYIGVTIGALTLIPDPALSQDTLFGADARHGGYGGVVLKGGPVMDDIGLFTGARGAWVIKFDRTHELHIGLGGYGLTTRHTLEGAESDDPTRHLAFGYGGLEIGYILNPDRLVHLAATTLIGAGGASHWERGLTWPNLPAPNVAFVLEPSIAAELNLTTFSRMNAGLSYRWVAGLDGEEVSNANLSGFSVVLGIILGRF